MEKCKYEANNYVYNNAISVELLDRDGNIKEYFKVFEDITRDKEQISLNELIDLQILEIKEICEFHEDKSVYKIPPVYKYIYLNERLVQNYVSKDNSFIGMDRGCHNLSISGANSNLIVSKAGPNRNINISGKDSYSIINGNNSKLSISGDFSQTAIFSDESNISISGNYSNVVIYGKLNRLAVSGHNAHIIIKDSSNKVSILGSGSKIKAVNNTWISLCEHNNGLSPLFSEIKSAQINNKYYTDYNGNILSENETYMLHQNMFWPIINYDGFTLVKLRTKNIGNIEITKCATDDYLGSHDKNVFVASKDGLSAHGDCIKIAIKDLENKLIKNKDIDITIKDIKSSGIVTKTQYRTITNACEKGMDLFAIENGYPADKDSISLEELLPILNNKYFGAKEFKELFK